MGQTYSSNQLYELRLPQPQLQLLRPSCQYCTNCQAYQPMSLNGLQGAPRCETFPGVEEYQRMDRFGRRKSIRKCVGIVVHQQGDPRPRTGVLIVGRDAAVGSSAEVRDLLMLEKRDKVVSLVPRGEMERRDAGKWFREVHRSWEEYLLMMPLVERRTKADVREWEMEFELQMWKAGQRSKSEFGGLRCGRGDVRR